VKELKNSAPLAVRLAVETCCRHIDGVHESNVLKLVYANVVLKRHLMAQVADIEYANL
jgi:hypothetical protein